MAQVPIQVLFESLALSICFFILLQVVPGYGTIHHARHDADIPLLFGILRLFPLLNETQMERYKPIFLFAAVTGEHTVTTLVILI